MSVQPESVDTCIVIDCNEWIRLKWLGSPIGLTFISALKRDPSLTLAIPEVLERELDKHRAQIARSLLAKLEDVTAEIVTVTGDSIAAGIVTLTEEDIEVAIRARQAGLKDQTIYPPMKIEEVRRALDRVNAETPPNGHKNQQMKDSLIWEACITLSDRYRVLFVTNDNGFYADRQKGKLAANLALEMPVKDRKLLVFTSLEEAMRSFAPESAVSDDSNEIAGIDIEGILARQAREVLERSSLTAELGLDIVLQGIIPSYFRTDTPHVFAVSFSAFFDVNRDVEDKRRGEIAIRGESQLDTRNGVIEVVSWTGIYWRSQGAPGMWIKADEKLEMADPSSDEANPTVRNTRPSAGRDI